MKMNLREILPKLLSTGIDECDYYSTTQLIEDNLCVQASEYLDSLLMFYDDTYYLKYDSDLKEIWNTMLDMAKQ